MVVNKSFQVQDEKTADISRRHQRFLREMTSQRRNSVGSASHWLIKSSTNQAPAVQKVDSAIQWINLYPVDNAIGFPNTYPQDSDLSGG